MFFRKNKEVSKNPQAKKKEPSYWERVILGKGTVSEPRPTEKEIWNNIKEEVKKVQEILNPTQKDKNS